MNNKIKCPVCLCENSCQRPRPGLLKCDICGEYKIDDNLDLVDLQYDSSHWDLSPLQRAALSHSIRKRSVEGSEPLEITSKVLDSFRSNVRLPSRAEQATNIIRFIGDEVYHSGESVGQLPPGFHAIIGARNRDEAIRLTEELVESKILKADPKGTAVESNPAGPPRPSFKNINLSLDGLKQYEVEKHGQSAGNYGFIAMQFGDDDDDLESFVREVVKPAVKEKIGYDLVDMRDRKKAGILDEIMRGRIRDAKFVIVDLTHDNSGAYWEAGYAEGLGKPVIYICEKEKFDKKGTHFDTHHCTTVFWSKSRDDDEGFCQGLTEIIRESIDESR